MTHDVFISHSSKDKSIADAVCSELEKAKIRCWIAPRDIRPGEKWAAAITNAIENGKIMVLIFSSNSHNSDDVLNEIYRKLDVFTKKYDVRFFEELPLYIQINIIESNKIIYSKDIFELYEYFYFIRKPWEGQKIRQQVTAAEMADILA